MFLVFLDYHLRYIYAEIEYMGEKAKMVLRRLFLYFVRGGDLPASVWDTRYPEHIAVHRSVNGGLVHVGFSVTPGMAVSMREN